MHSHNSLTVALFQELNPFLVASHFSLSPLITDSHSGEFEVWI